MTPMLEGKKLYKTYASHGSVVSALNRVDFSLQAGERVAIIGESGSGKSTLIMSLLGLQTVDSGTLTFEGADLKDRQALKALRRNSSLVMQNPVGSLNPRMRVLSLVEEPLQIHCDDSKLQRRERATQMLLRVGLPIELHQRFPSQLSGGQCQRVAIARALVHRPKLVVLDEPTAALDVSVQAQIVCLLAELCLEMSLSLILTTHDLGLVPHLADRVLVMRRGYVLEEATVADLFSRPKHRYTQDLIAAIPKLKSNLGAT
jgi:ABC-type glutathione transport system ATPase component